MIKTMAKKIREFNKKLNKHTENMTIVRDNLKAISQDQSNTLKDMKTICISSLERNIVR